MGTPVQYTLRGDRRLVVRAVDNELVVSVESRFDGEWLRFATIHTNDEELIVGTPEAERVIDSHVDDTPMFFAHTMPVRAKEAAGWVNAASVRSPAAALTK